MADPRTSIINERLDKVDRIIAVSSGKGGVGKSLVASTIALILAKKGCKVGLFDLDFTSPSTHTILGIEGVQPKEEKGIVPPKVHGIEYMSITYYSSDRGAPLRGADVSNALLELLSITKWGKLDSLILDMPPGIGDATLDLLRLIKKVEFLIVTTPSQLAFGTVKKLVSLLQTLRIPILGVIENMKMDPSDKIRLQTGKLDLKFLTEIPYDSRVEEAIGHTERLLCTALGEKLAEVSSSFTNEIHLLSNLSRDAHK